MYFAKTVKSFFRHKRKDTKEFSIEDRKLLSCRCNYTNTERTWLEGPSDQIRSDPEWPNGANG